MGDKVIKKNVKQHPSNEKVLAAKSAANKASAASAALAATKGAAKPAGKK